MKELFASFDIWNLLEIFAVITGMYYVYLQVKQTRRMWRWMIVASIFNAVVYFHKGFYSMTIIQFYYIGMSIYGIIKWSAVFEKALEQHGPDDRKARTKIAIKVPTKKRLALAFGAAAVAFVGMLLITRSNYTYIPGDVPYKPYWDAAVAVLSMLATYLLSQSYIQNWYVWIIVNVTGITMFLYPVFVGHSEQALVLVGLLYCYYLCTSIIGLINWKKKGVIVK